MITPVPDWPRWLKILVMAPGAVLLGYALCGWWPKSRREWRTFGFVLAYTIAYYSVMVFVFHFR